MQTENTTSSYPNVVPTKRWFVERNEPHQVENRLKLLPTASNWIRTGSDSEPFARKAAGAETSKKKRNGKKGGGLESGVGRWIVRLGVSELVGLQIGSDVDARGHPITTYAESQPFG